MTTKKKMKTQGQDVLKGFHCDGDMDGRSQADLWYFLIEGDQILYCERCTADHNARVASTGKAQKMTVAFAPNGLVQFMAKRWDANPPFLQNFGKRQ